MISLALGLLFSNLYGISFYGLCGNWGNGGWGGCGFPAWGGWGGWGGWPVGAGGYGGGGVGGGYAQEANANAYGAGVDNVGYGQDAYAVNSVNADVDIGASGAYETNEYQIHQGNEYLVRNIQENSWSGQTGYNMGNARGCASLNNAFGNSNFGGAANSFANAAGINNMNGGGYGCNGGMGGGMWGF
ncbi:uncharacterized protein MONOS_7695 [Monocercomonoides exilis]|uniref:uncharacterized protein n=1 Tax=Monocercomonoides exilis TaxID=2049356 RepID=UPI0035596751|nr:hypothetical protein MONOS_7695 [Monocercomonoides exilis]|eukprot:MONOS_7695.1-p1 / transcript=MONOS_7695.1 / gene=MONOS_7695 / organism=Monocercomonoides_exilis_PA203 / gene_product=unspecified product / transcript_product=unspecified product / location=Mono_scaffold00269:74246-74806(-) / protein_length=187 / sequence_SO=supercontig / SO=protein_coding / is_pseudo=false